jgi:hypothetical protein
MTVHSWNWYFGWSLVLSGFATGAGLGLFFHQPDFLGGYSSFRRRIIRLGHISQAALGMMNVLYALSPWPLGGTYAAWLAGTCFTIGGISMPTVCFLTGWQERFRHLFFIPVIALVLAIAFTLMGGPP